jgi:hypothetical protein
LHFLPTILISLLFETKASIHLVSFISAVFSFQFSLKAATAAERRNNRFLPIFFCALQSCLLPSHENSFWHLTDSCTMFIRIVKSSSEYLSFSRLAISFLLLMVLLQFRLFSPPSALSITQFNELFCFLGNDADAAAGLIPMRPSSSLPSSIRNWQKKVIILKQINIVPLSLSRATKGADIFHACNNTERRQGNDNTDNNE